VTRPHFQLAALYTYSVTVCPLHLLSMSGAEWTKLFFFQDFSWRLLLAFPTEF